MPACFPPPAASTSLPSADILLHPWFHGTSRPGVHRGHVKRIEHMKHQPCTPTQFLPGGLPLPTSEGTSQLFPHADLDPACFVVPGRQWWASFQPTARLRGRGHLRAFSQPYVSLPTWARDRKPQPTFSPPVPRLPSHLTSVSELLRFPENKSCLALCGKYGVPGSEASTFRVLSD